MRKLKMISGLVQDISFIAIVWNAESNCTCQKKKIISYSNEVHRRYQNNTYVTGCIFGKTFWRLLARRWRSRIIRCMDRFHKIYFSEWQATWRIFMVRGQINKKTDDLKARQYMAGYVEAHVWCIESQREATVGNQRNQSSKTPRDYVVFSLLIPDEEFECTMPNARRKLEIPMPAVGLGSEKKWYGT